MTERNGSPELEAVRLILRGAQTQPPEQMRQTIVCLIDAIDLMIDGGAPPATRRRLRLIQGGLTSAAAVSTSALGHAGRLAGQHPAAAVAAASAVAIAGTVAGALYLSGNSEPSQSALQSPTPATVAPTTGQPETAPQPHADPSRAPFSAPPSPKTGHTAPPQTRTMGTGRRTLVPTVSPTLGLPLISPSPSDQHPTCVRMHVLHLGGRIAVCIRT